MSEFGPTKTNRSKLISVALGAATAISPVLPSTEVSAAINPAIMRDISSDYIGSMSAPTKDSVRNLTILGPTHTPNPQ